MVALWTLLLGGTAHAADCPAPYSVDAMLSDLVAVETFLRNQDDPNAGKAAEALSTGLNCMNELLPRMIVGRALRAVGSGFVAGGNAEVGEDWLRTAAQLEQSFDFGVEDLPLEHPVREVFANAKRTAETDPVPVEGRTFVAGKVWLDGKEVTAPAARIDQWHIVQHDAGTGVRSWVIDGNRFPDELLAEAAPVVAGKVKKVKEPKPPKETVVVGGQPGRPAPMPASPRPRPEPTAGLDTKEFTRDRPWEKTPLMAVGGAVGVGAGVVYFLSWRSRQAFEDETADLDALDKSYRTTNQLFIASWAVLAVGAGTFTWGAILDGDTPMPAVRVRF